MAAKFRVKELARERGLTSEELAHKSGLKISTVRNLWQNRVSDPAYSTVAALAQALGVQIEDLVEKNSQDTAPNDEIRRLYLAGVPGS
jgi:transcriptional regulator with XRE-family HTH domain